MIKGRKCMEGECSRRRKENEVNPVGASMQITESSWLLGRVFEDV